MSRRTGNNYSGARWAFARRRTEYVYHNHPRPFCGEGCPAYGESLLIQRYPRSTPREKRERQDG